MADEIAYNCADLDDGYEAKLLTLPLIRSSLPMFNRIYPGVERMYPHAAEKLKFNEALKRLLDALVTDLIESTRARLEEGGIRIRRTSPRQRAAPDQVGTAHGAQNREIKRLPLMPASIRIASLIPSASASPAASEPFRVLF